MDIFKNFEEILIRIVSKFLRKFWDKFDNILESLWNIWKKYLWNEE